MSQRRAWALSALIIGAAIDNLEAQSPPALFPFTVDDKHGMIDRAGKVVIPPEYSEPVVFRDGLARVAKGTKVISPRFVWVRPFHQGLAFVGEPGSRGAYIDTTGRVVWTSQ